MTDKLGQFGLDDDELIKNAQHMTERNRLMREALTKLAMPPLPQNNWETNTQQGDPGKFASPAMGQTNATFGPPAPTSPELSAFNPSPHNFSNFGVTLKGAGQGLASVPQTVYSHIKQLMEHGYTPGGEDVQGVKNAANVSTDLLGMGGLRGAMSPALAAGETELNAFKAGVGAKGGGGRPTYFTPDKQDRLLSLADKHQGTPGANKKIINEFRRNNPDYTGTDSNLLHQMYRYKNLKSGSFETGAFGGRGKLDTESPGEAINWLQSQQPVTQKWLEQWAKEAGVPFKAETKPGGTTYTNLLPEPPITKIPPQVRIPEDQHWGRPLSNSEVGRRFDTGISPGRENNFRSKQEAGLINASGQSYAHPEALEKALELATGQSRTNMGTPGGFKLVSPDYAPRTSPKGEAFPEGKIKPDLNQGTLFSNKTDPTTAALMQLLQERAGDITGGRTKVFGGTSPNIGSIEHLNGILSGVKESSLEAANPINIFPGRLRNAANDKKIGIVKHKKDNE